MREDRDRDRLRRGMGRRRGSRGCIISDGIRGKRWFVLQETVRACLGMGNIAASERLAFWRGPVGVDCLLLGRTGALDLAGIVMVVWVARGILAIL